MEIIFNYDQIETAIQSDLNDPFNQVLLKFAEKTQLDIKHLEFLSNGKVIQKGDKVSDLINEEEKKKQEKNYISYSYKWCYK